MHDARSRRRSLQEWALAQRSLPEQLAAIELVLTHDFDEPSTDPVPRLAAAQSARERYLLEVTGIAVPERARVPIAGSATEGEFSVPSRLAA